MCETSFLCMTFYTIIKPTNKINNLQAENDAIGHELQKQLEDAET
ncbi:hypothetical protein CASFOL_034355 [Castilleja foliolosa]|uniref:Uncharacterized protein n=1 Tax=Castilleja foliolosa TaxID=1961234 RepID=A0ABD3BW10_9LAMI